MHSNSNMVVIQGRPNQRAWLFSFEQNHGSTGFCRRSPPRVGGQSASMPVPGECLILQQYQKVGYRRFDP